MYLIKNKIYIDVEPYIDFESFKAIEKDIILGIVKSRPFVVDGGCSYINQYDKQFKSNIDEASDQAIHDESNPNYEYFKKLNFNFNDCKNFIKYADYTIQMGSAISLRIWKSTASIFQKGESDSCIDTAVAKNFPELMEWIANLNAFDSVGRIGMFFNAPNEKHAIHKDMWVGKPDEFILINLNLDRKDIFILDDDGNHIVVRSKAFVFDPRNWHGTEGKDFFSWTLRIDGSFNREWLKSVGIADYYK